MAGDCFGAAGFGVAPSLEGAWGGWFAIGSGESGFCASAASGARPIEAAESRAIVFVARLMMSNFPRPSPFL
jgi:hypothetical protein